MTKNTEIRATIDSEVYGTLRLWYNPSEDELLYCAKDAAKMFGFKDPGKVANDRCLNVIKEKHYTSSGIQTLNFIDKTEIDKLVMSDFSIGKMCYIRSLAQVRDMSVTQARKKTEKIIVDEISTMVKLFNKKSDRINDAILVMPNGKTYHIKEDGSIYDISEAVVA